MKYTDVSNIPKKRCSLEHRVLSINTDIQLSKKCLLTDDFDSNTNKSNNIVQSLLKASKPTINVTKIKRDNMDSNNIKIKKISYPFSLLKDNNIQSPIYVTKESNENKGKIKERYELAAKYDI